MENLMTLVWWRFSMTFFSKNQITEIKVKKDKEKTKKSWRDEVGPPQVKTFLKTLLFTHECSKFTIFLDMSIFPQPEIFKLLRKCN